MADAPPGLPAAEDHRVRVGRQRTERMRVRLLATILATYRGDHARGPAVLDEMLARAKASKATFYKHFASLEAAVVALGDELADEMAATIILNSEHVDRPRVRLAIGFQLFLARAAMDPRWRTFVTHGRFLNPEHKLLVEVRKDFERGVLSGDYRIDDVEAAVALTIGAMVEGMRHMSDKPGHRYGRTLVVMTLCAMGVSASEAEATVAHASKLLHRDAGNLYPWWRGDNTLPPADPRASLGAGDAH